MFDDTSTTKHTLPPRLGANRWTILVGEDRIHRPQYVPAGYHRPIHCTSISSFSRLFTEKIFSRCSTEITHTSPHEIFPLHRMVQRFNKTHTCKLRYRSFCLAQSGNTSGNTASKQAVDNQDVLRPRDK